MEGRLKRIRREKGLTREELARKVGVSAACIAELEREQGVTTAEVLRRVASALGKTVEEIFLP